MKQPPEKAHALFAPSGAERWIECPPSIPLTQKAPPAPSSAQADEGSDAHTCLEFFFKEVKKGNTILSARKQLLAKFPEEMVLHAQDAYVEITGMVPKGAEVFSEVKVDISPFTQPGQFGTSDAAIVQEFSKLTVVDFKYGAGHVVEVKENKQLILYALGWAHRFDYNFEEVELVVIQPRAPHKDGSTRKWSTTMAELLEVYPPIYRRAVKQAKDPKTPYKVGEHCFFCPGKIICKEHSKKAFEKAKIAFEEADGLPVAQSVPMVVGNKISPAALGAVLDSADLIESWIESVRSHAHAVLTAGVPIPGWKLEPKRSMRKWADVKKAAKDALKFPRSIELTTAPELKSPAQVEEALEEAGLDGKAWVKKREVKISSGFNVARDTQQKERQENGKSKSKTN